MKQNAFSTMGTETIPLAEDIQKLWDITGTMSLLSMGHGRGLEREKELDRPTLPKVESDSQRQRPGGSDKGPHVEGGRVFSGDTLSPSIHCSVVFSIFLAFRGR